MKNLFKNKILLSFIIFVYVPLIMVILDVKLSSYKNFNNLIFDYNSNLAIFGYLSDYTSSLFFTIFLIIYNLGISFFLYYISDFTKKHIISISIIIAVFTSFFGGLLTTL